MKKTNKKGFTLVELLLVIAIIGILAAVLFVSLGKQRERARKTTFKENMRGLVTTYTACVDSGGKLNATNAPAAINGQAACTGGAANIGNLPVLSSCTGAGNSEILSSQATGDFWTFNARCGTSDGTNTYCWANCNADGCVYCNTQLAYTNGAWGACASDTYCE